MSGTPEKILEHFLETMRLEATLNEATGTCMAEAVLFLPHKMDLLGEHCNMMLWRAPSGSFFPEEELSTALKQPQEN